MLLIFKDRSPPPKIHHSHTYMKDKTKCNRSIQTHTHTHINLWKLVKKMQRHIMWREFNIFEEKKTYTNTIGHKL